MKKFFLMLSAILCTSIPTIFNIGLINSNESINNCQEIVIVGDGNYINCNQQL